MTSRSESARIRQLLQGLTEDEILELMRMISPKFAPADAETRKKAVLPDPNEKKSTKRYENLKAAERRYFEEAYNESSELWKPLTIEDESDWLNNHPESGQTFGEWFTKEFPQHRVNRQRRTIYILPLGPFPPGHAGQSTAAAGATAGASTSTGETGGASSSARGATGGAAGGAEGGASPSSRTDKVLLAWLQKFCQCFFLGVDVKFLDPVRVREVRCRTRINEHTKQWQLLSKDILDYLVSKKPRDAICLVAVTMLDLYPSDSWNFVFGQASLVTGCGVFSFARYDENFYYIPRDRKKAKKSELEEFSMPPVTSVLLLRACKVMTHELCHMFGMKHCIYFSCCINGSNSRDESDRRPVDLCPVCLRKLQEAVDFRLAVRFRAMLQYCTKESWDSGVPAPPLEAFEPFKKWLEKVLVFLEETPAAGNEMPAAGNETPAAGNEESSQASN
ncbi:archaemetzincin-2-like isoform X2 [Branchiostoma floridae x Branchiostoma japonicum]